MQRFSGCRLEAEISGVADIVLSVAVAAVSTIVDESLVVTLDGNAVALRELVDEHGSRLHCADGLGPGTLFVDYRVEASGTEESAPVTEIDLIRYARPSRYCESDRLAAFARAEFVGLSGRELVDAVTDWVWNRVAYISGSSRPTDGAVATMLARQGVCRDFAHLVIAMLRACDTPARLVSVYAPGLSPMDFHAVVEAHVDGSWWVTDATGLAPRTAMSRIATGRDSADTAFLTVAGDTVGLNWLDVTAYTDGMLPVDDRAQPARLW